MADAKISALTGYTPAVDADVVPIVDTTTATTKKITWANVKATLKTYFDTLYHPVAEADTTAGVGNPPATSSTQTITHGLGRTPKIIRIVGIGKYTAGASSSFPTPSVGTYNSSGNRCVYCSGNGTQAATPSTSIAIYVEATSFIYNTSGVIGNVTATTFDIVWTAGSANVELLNCAYLWEAE